jgi:hypothetical protein
MYDGAIMAVLVPYYEIINSVPDWSTGTENDE